MANEVVREANFSLSKLRLTSRTALFLAKSAPLWKSTNLVCFSSKSWKLAMPLFSNPHLERLNNNCVNGQMWNGTSCAPPMKKHLSPMIAALQHSKKCHWKCLKTTFLEEQLISTQGNKPTDGAIPIHTVFHWGNTCNEHVSFGHCSQLLLWVAPEGHKVVNLRFTMWP